MQLTALIGGLLKSIFQGADFIFKLLVSLSGCREPLIQLAYFTIQFVDLFFKNSGVAYGRHRTVKLLPGLRKLGSKRCYISGAVCAVSQTLHIVTQLGHLGTQGADFGFFFLNDRSHLRDSAGQVFIFSNLARGIIMTTSCFVKPCLKFLNTGLVGGILIL